MITNSFSAFSFLRKHQPKPEFVRHFVRMPSAWLVPSMERNPKMQTTITRRTALAASVTLPLLPVTAYAMHADPAVEAYREWRAAYDAYVASNDSEVEDTPEWQVLSDCEWAARLALSDAVATTSAGLAYQVRFAFGVFGNLSNGGNIDNPADFEFGNIWADDHEGRLLRSILAGAENMEAVA
jgi:hypothetical protein